MLFASFDFLLFFAIAFVAYWALARRPWWRAAWVVAASYFFYMAGAKPVKGPLPTPWYFVGLLVVSTVVDYVCSQRIEEARRRSERGEGSSRAGAVWLGVSLVTNLALLGYFKYTGFLLQVASDIASLWGGGGGFPRVEMLLPVGISFYTFQSLGYTIDVYRGKIPAEKSLLRFAAFISFFPQLVAGPIVRGSELLPQLARRPALTREDVDFAAWRITKGLVKKVFLGDFIAATFTDIVFASPSQHSSAENLVALYAFTLQIYADFSGYSDIAIGVARLLGVRLPENFDRPYQAVDVADFWRRWHMTLSTWLRDYVYYPLGGSRVSDARTYVNLWITMFLVGIWHGASWNFVIYANIHAFAMVYNRVGRRAPSWRARLARVALASVGVALGMTLLGRVGLKLPHPWMFGLGAGGVALVIGVLPSVDEVPATRALHVLLTLHFSVLSRVFFRATDLASARAMIGKLLHWDGIGVRTGMFRIPKLSAWLAGVPSLWWARPLAEWGVLVLLLGGLALHYTPSRSAEPRYQRWISRAPAVVVGVGLAAVAAVVSLLLAGPRANIYFAF